MPDPTLRIKLDATQAQAQLSQFQRRASATAIAIGASFALLTFRKIIKELSESQAAFAHLEAGVKSTGGAAGHSAQELAKMAGALSRVSNAGDEAIMRRENSGNIRKAAIQQGMTTLMEDGFSKVASGLTSIEELLRAVTE